MLAVRNFCVALQFLTVLPARLGEKAGGEELAGAAKFFPVVGLLIGLISYGAFTLVERWVPSRIAAIVLLALPIVLTGGLHLDGFSDFCDGFFSARRKEEILRIMKDSRIGVMGVLGLILLLLTKYEILVHLFSQWRLYLFTVTAARWGQVVLASFLPYAGVSEGMAKRFVGALKPKELAWSSFVFLGILVALGPFFAFHLVCLMFFLLLLGLGFKRTIGGVTGDLLGASSELSELFILITALFLRPI